MDALEFEGEALIERYGNASAAALLVKFHNLIAILSNNESASNADSIKAYKILQEHYDVVSRKLAPSPHSKFVHKKRSGNFEISRYATDVAAHQLERYSEIELVDKNNPGHIKSGAFYIYAITLSRELIISRWPISICGLFERKSSDSLNHAHLVQGYKFSVLCAGEIIFINSRHRFSAAILNNRSGHFLPSKTALYSILPVLAKILAIPITRIYPIAVDRNHGV